MKDLLWAFVAYTFAVVLFYVFIVRVLIDGGL